MALRVKPPCYLEIVASVCMAATAICKAQRETRQKRGKDWYIEISAKLGPELRADECLRGKWLKNAKPEDFEAYRRERNVLTRAIRDAKKVYIGKQIAN